MGAFRPCFPLSRVSGARRSAPCLSRLAPDCLCCRGRSLRCSSDCRRRPAKRRSPYPTRPRRNRAAPTWASPRRPSSFRRLFLWRLRQAPASRLSADRQLCWRYRLLRWRCRHLCWRYRLLCQLYRLLCQLYRLLCWRYRLLCQLYRLLDQLFCRPARSFSFPFVSCSFDCSLLSVTPCRAVSKLSLPQSFCLTSGHEEGVRGGPDEKLCVSYWLVYG